MARRGMASEQNREDAMISTTNDRTLNLPAFIETAPGRFESIEQCTAEQIRAEAAEQRRKARKLSTEARDLEAFAADRARFIPAT
jgi:hypothetical protein